MSMNPPCRSGSPTPSVPHRESRSSHGESNDPKSPTPCTSQSESDLPDDELGYTSEGDTILSMTKCRSTVWQHFQKIKIKGTTDIKARCLHCKSKLVGDSKSGTTHLTTHTTTCMKKQYVARGQKVLTPSLFMGDGKKGNMQPYTYDPQVCRRQLATMIIVHEYPLSIVEHVEFRQFCYYLQPMFHVVSRNTVKKDIIEIYDVEKVKTMKVMDKNKSRISLTTDMWTSTCKKKGFMVITSHFIDDSWKLQSRILRFVYVPCPHGAEELCDVMMKTCWDWNIDMKLNTLTVDNATTNDAMVDLFLERFEGDHIRSKSFFHIRCAAHVLNLIVKDGLDVIMDSIEKVRDSVAYWTTTPKRKEKFDEATRQLGILYTKVLALDNNTRWNSTFLMLQTAIEYKSVFGRLRLKDPKFRCCPNEDDWNMAKEICEKLEVFYKVTLLFSGTSYPTSNLFFPDVCDIKVKLTEWVCCGNEVVELMAEKMIEKYDKYWDNTHGFLAVAVVLDPRFKMSLIEYYYTRIYGEHGFEMAEDIRKRCYDLLTLYQGKNKDCNEASSKGPSTYLRGRDSLNDYEAFLNQQKKTKTMHVKSELDHYLEEEQLPRCEDFDILAWWKSNGLKYPTLQVIARDVLSVPVSTVASESAFSTSGRVLNPTRNRLRPETLEALICAQSWLKVVRKGEIQNFNDEESEDHDEEMSDVTYIE